MNHLTLKPATGPPPIPSPVFESNPTYTLPDSDQLVTLRDLLRVLRIHGLKIIMLGAVAGVLAMGAVSLIPPVYMGKALVMVDQQRSRIINEQTDPSVLSNLPSDPASIESQVQLMQSPSLAGQVVDRLKLADDPEFNGSKASPMGMVLNAPHVWISRLVHAAGLGGNGSGPASQDLPGAQVRREQTIGKFLSGLNVHAVGLSTVIEVDYRSTSPQKAARMANAVASTYIKNLTDAKSDASEGASQWLADRVSQLARQAAAADSAVQEYKSANGLVDTSNGTAMTDQQLSDLTSQLIQAQGEEAQAKAKLARVQQLVRSGHGANSSDVVASPLISQLREQEATLQVQRADLASRYGPLHPAMKDVESRLQELRGKIAEETARIVDTAGNDVAVAAARADAIRSNMAMATSATATQNQSRVKLAQLQAEATSDHALYQSYLDRLKQTQQQASLRVPDVHLASPASPPLAPVAPRKMLIVGGAIVASLVLGFLLALASDRMCSGFRYPRDLESILGLPVLAVIPELNVRSKSFKDVAMRVLARTHNEFAEAIRGLEIGLSMHLDDGGDDGRRCGKAILVTSALPAEGKTAISVSLARRLAISGHKVVVIDADYRRPKVALALGLRGVKYDLADYLARRCSLEEALCPDPYSPLVVLPAVHTAEGGEMISSSAMAALITRLRGVADFVIIDSPPVLAVNDTRLLAGMADRTVFVVRWGETPREAAALAVRLLRDFRVKLAGAVLARANARQQQYYTFGYTGAPALADYSKNLAA